MPIVVRRVAPDSGHFEVYEQLLAEAIAFGDQGTEISRQLAIDFADRDAATAWLRDEPFTRAGLYAATAVHAFVNLWPQRAGFPPPA